MEAKLGQHQAAGGSEGVKMWGKKVPYTKHDHLDDLLFLSVDTSGVKEHRSDLTSSSKVGSHHRLTV